MGNLYSRYSLQSLSIADVARLSFGRAAPMPPPSIKTRPSVRSFFRGAVQTDPSAIDQPVWVLGGGALGGFGALGDVDMAGVKFTNHDAFNDFAIGVQLRGSAGMWNGVPPQFLNRLNEAVKAAKDGTNGERAVAKFRTEAQGYANTLSQLQQFGIGGRSESQDSPYVSTMMKLHGLMQRATDEILAANEKDAIEDAATIAKQAKYAELKLAAAKFTKVGQQTGASTSTDSGMPKWAVPVGIGAVLLVGGFIISRKS